MPSSALPAELEAQGYKVIPAGGGERILAGSIVERFTRRADGELEPLTEGSTPSLDASGFDAIVGELVQLCRSMWQWIGMGTERRTRSRAIAHFRSLKFRPVFGMAIKITRPRRAFKAASVSARGPPSEAVVQADARKVTVVVKLVVQRIPRIARN